MPAAGLLPADPADLWELLGVGDAPPGQAVLTPSASFPAIEAAEAQLLGHERRRSSLHADRLRDVLRLVRLNEQELLGAGTAAGIALLLNCSEWKAHDLIDQACLLDRLPGGFAQLEQGLFTEEHTRAVATGLGCLAPPDAELVWTHLLARLASLRAQGAAYPPARLHELIRQLIAQLLPDELADSRDRGRGDDDVTYERNHDGTYDLHTSGISAPNAQAALSTIAMRAQPAGEWDTRTAGERRRDAVVDLLTGRDPLLRCPGEPFVDDDGRVLTDPEHVLADAAKPTTCGCSKGTQVPCGVAVHVLVPLATALGLADAPAVMTGPAGHDVLDRQLLTQLLLNAPALQAVFVDDRGIPVAVAEDVEVPERHDPAGLREALLRRAAAPPGEYFPVAPGDHPVAAAPPDRDATAPRGAVRSHAGSPDAGSPGDGPPGDGPPGDGPLEEGPPDSGPPRTPGPRRPGDTPAGASTRRAESPTVGELALARAALGLSPGAAPPGGATRRAHREHGDDPGPYSIRPRLRRLLVLRAPRCEWPGCGARAVRCDLDHDTAYPDGPTCACNLGALCRHHHRVKQTGWTKTRLRDGSVRFTSPTGRSWTSPVQHVTKPAATGALGTDTAARPEDVLGPAALEEEERHADPGNPTWDAAPDDPAPLAATAGLEHGDTDRVGDAIAAGETRWSLDLRDPYRWLPPLEPATPLEPPVS